MQELSLVSQISLYVLMALIGVYTLLVGVVQVMVLKGKAMKNPDGSSDDWHEQKTHYGIAFADLVLACPVSIVGIVLVFFAPRWGYYLLALVSFWFVWANTMTTATSLRFEKPNINLNWFLVFPFGIFVGLTYLVWTFIHFDTIYCM
ncbi:MAG: hypothetical protein QNJ34_22550 [Xenococcaceae cyanobacterium MO_188.B29]|nr:hypothetical protein [Xenococcaceae cyanobacterium MO_188.B29]